MNIFFDMDYTLLAYDGTLRPRATEVLERLKGDGHHLYIWSGVGVRVEEATRLGLALFVRGIFQKPTEDFEEGLMTYQIPVRPDLVIDDHEEVVNHFGGVVVRPYFWPDPSDRELERLYHKIQSLSPGL